MQEKNFKHDALDIIAEYFGEYTKTLYIKFYEDKPLETVFASLEELLLEMMGQEKTDSILADFKKKYHLTSSHD